MRTSYVVVWMAYRRLIKAASFWLLKWKIGLHGGLFEDCPNLLSHGVLSCVLQHGLNPILRSHLINTLQFCSCAVVESIECDISLD